MLLKVLFKGEKYFRHSGTWVDESFITVTKGIQRSLNQCYKDQYLNDLSRLSDEQILLEAKYFKNNESPDLALDLLLYLYKKHSFINILASMVTSCYRMMGNSEAAISFYEEVLSVYGYSMTTPELLTSVAAAFLDIKQYKKAKELCAQAYSKSSGKPSDELRNVYQRLRSEVAFLFD